MDKWYVIQHSTKIIPVTFSRVLDTKTVTIKYTIYLQNLHGICFFHGY